MVEPTLDQTRLHQLVSDKNWKDALTHMHGMRRGEIKGMRMGGTSKMHTILHVLAAYGAPPELMIKSMESGCPVNALNELGHTPLFSGLCHAAEYETLRPLLDAHGTDVIRTYATHDIGLGCARDYYAARKFNPLVICMQCGSAGFTFALHESTYDANITRALLKRGANVDALDAQGDSALHVAVRRAHFDAAYALVEYGADLNRINRQGNTPFQLAHDASRGDSVAQAFVRLVAETDQTRKRAREMAVVMVLEGA